LVLPSIVFLKFISTNLAKPKPRPYGLGFWFGMGIWMWIQITGAAYAGKLHNSLCIFLAFGFPLWYKEKKNQR